MGITSYISPKKINNGKDPHWSGGNGHNRGDDTVGLGRLAAAGRWQRTCDCIGRWRTIARMHRRTDWDLGAMGWRGEGRSIIWNMIEENEMRGRRSDSGEKNIEDSWKNFGCSH